MGNLMFSKEDIIKMTVSEYQERFGKDPMEIINGLDHKTEAEIEHALYEHAHGVTYGFNETEG